MPSGKKETPPQKNKKRQVKCNKEQEKSLLRHQMGITYLDQ
jgi:hypothetical protein